MRRTTRATRCAIFAFVVSCILLVDTLAPAAAKPTEIEVLMKIPHIVLDDLAFDAKPDAQGAMQANVGMWHGVVYQRVAIPLIWTGAVEGDASKVDDGWRAIDLAFAHQLDDGSFETADGKPTPPSDMSFWVEAVCHALLVVQESSLAERYSARIAALQPKIAKASAWLEKPINRKNLLGGDYYTSAYFSSNRLFVDATAFLAASRLRGDSAPLIYAREFLNDAVSRQITDGTFAEYGGFDSSYQGVSLLHASYYALRDPSGKLSSALAQGLKRELRAVSTQTGVLDSKRNTRTAGQEKVFGHMKTVDYRAVILGLYYAALYLDDADGLRAAKRVFEFAFPTAPHG